MVTSSRSGGSRRTSSLLLLLLTALAAATTTVHAHGGQAGHGEGHDNGATYAERHMMTEHHIDSWVSLSLSVLSSLLLIVLLCAFLRRVTCLDAIVTSLHHSN